MVRHFLFVAMTAILIMHMAVIMIVMAMVVAAAGTIRRMFVMVMALQREQVERSAACTERHGAGAHQA